MKHKINKLDLQIGFVFREWGTPGTSPLAAPTGRAGQGRASYHLPLVRVVCGPGPRGCVARRRPWNSGWCGLAAANLCDLGEVHQLSRLCVPSSVKSECWSR